jgi:hypothetical protein
MDSVVQITLAVGTINNFLSFFFYFSARPFCFLIVVKIFVKEKYKKLTCTINSILDYTILYLRLNIVLMLLIF